MLLEFLLIVTNVGTAVVLYPIAKRQNRVLAIGYVAARVIECVFIAAGIIFVLGIVSLRQTSPDAADLAVSLGSLKDWTFLFGPGFVVPFGNGLILGYLMYKSGLVPWRMTWFGMVGGPILLISSLGTLFGSWEAGNSIPGLLVAPEFIWEAFLGNLLRSGASGALHQSCSRARLKPHPVAWRPTGARSAGVTFRPLCCR